MSPARRYVPELPLSCLMTVTCGADTLDRRMFCGGPGSIVRFQVDDGEWMDTFQIKSSQCLNLGPYERP